MVFILYNKGNQHTKPFINMKKKLYAIPLMLAFAFTACEKDDNDPKPTANVTVINAAVDAGPIKVAGGAGNVPFPFSQATAIAYGTNGSFASFPGTNTITVVSSTDTTKTFFSRTLNLQPISTLYIAGQSPASAS
jgi:hypothetical protein